MTHDPERMEVIVQLVRQAMRNIIPGMDRSDFKAHEVDAHDASLSIAERVAVDVPDCTWSEVSAAMGLLAKEAQRRVTIFDAVQRIASRMAEPPTASESAHEIVERAARAGDREALELLQTLDEPLERSYVRATSI